ncbi:MAG TPA: hypothetical protein VGK23_07355, partial [Methanomassiliicoccales archaeon]
MTSNDRIILDTILKQKKEKLSPESKEDEFFELFVFDQVLKNYDMSFDELKTGRTGDYEDGGVDGFFIFINESLIDEKIKKSEYKQNPKIDLFIIQAKREKGFTEGVIEKLLATSKDTLDLAKDVKPPTYHYNEKVVESIGLFKATYLCLVDLHPSLFVHFVYACKGETKTINSNMNSRLELLRQTVGDLFDKKTKVEVQMLGAHELLDLSYVEKTYTLQLTFFENSLSKVQQGSSNYVVLSSLPDFYKFITDPENNL